MAAIAEISSLKEWEHEWETLEDELQTFKQSKFLEYQKVMGSFHSSQKSCVSVMTQLRRKLRDFKETLKKIKNKTASAEETMETQELDAKIALLEMEIWEMQQSLPSQAGWFLKLCLGNINVSLYNQKSDYKNDYEKLKLKMTVISMVLALTNTFVLNYRLSDALFHAVLLWYYSTLTLQEHILIANGSRIKGWWVLHHYFSILLSGLLLIWPDGHVYQLFRRQFFYFSLYLSFVQLLQFKYQSGVLYRLRALGISKKMDVTKEGFHTWMWKGLSFIIPFLFFGYLFQFYNAYTLYRLAYHPDCKEWQVMALSANFFILSGGNMTTLLMVMRQKMKPSLTIPRMPCS